MRPMVFGRSGSGRRAVRALKPRRVSVVALNIGPKVKPSPDGLYLQVTGVGVVILTSTTQYFHCIIFQVKIISVSER